MKVLGLDFETQSVDAKTTRITEIGAVLYNYQKDNYFVEAGKDPNDPINRVPVQTWQKITSFQAFCFEEKYPPQTDFIVELTGITDHMLMQYGRPRKEQLEKLLPLVQEADVIVAHNIQFDKTVLESTASLFELSVPPKEWLCTLSNFPWPKKFTCHKLSHLAYDHSILVDPATLHRAVDDVELMFKLLAKYDFGEVLTYSREPWAYMWASPLGPWQGKGGDGGIQTGIAKSLGFAWERVKGCEHTWPKKWVTRVKQSQMQALISAVEASESPFNVDRIQGIQ